MKVMFCLLAERIQPERPSGRSIREWMYQFVANELKKSDLISIAKDEDQSVGVQTAKFQIDCAVSLPTNTRAS